MSETEYNAWQEASLLMKSENNRKALLESITSVRRGEGKVLTPEEWEKMNR